MRHPLRPSFVVLHDPITIGAGIAAGGQIVSTIVGSRGANKAAEQQVASADRALETIGPLYQPYTALGAGAAGRLGNLMGITAPAGPTGQRSGVLGADPNAPGTGGRPRGDRPVTGHAVPRGSVPPAGTLGGLNHGDARLAAMGVTPPVQTHARAQTASGYGGEQVMMQAPDGTQQPVPPDQVAHYERLGARRVA